jgi:hypothetical protein
MEVGVVAKAVVDRDDKPDIPPDAAAEYIGVSSGTLTQWRYRGKGPAYYRGLSREILYRRADLDEFIASCRVVPSTKRRVA